MDTLLRTAFTRSLMINILPIRTMLRFFQIQSLVSVYQNSSGSISPNPCWRKDGLENELCGMAEITIEVMAAFNSTRLPRIDAKDAFPFFYDLGRVPTFPAFSTNRARSFFLQRTENHMIYKTILSLIRLAVILFNHRCAVSYQ